MLMEFQADILKLGRADQKQNHHQTSEDRRRQDPDPFGEMRGQSGPAYGYPDPDRDQQNHAIQVVVGRQFASGNKEQEAQEWKGRERHWPRLFPPHQQGHAGHERRDRKLERLAQGPGVNQSRKSPGIVEKKETSINVEILAHRRADVARRHVPGISLKFLEIRKEMKKQIRETSQAT